MENIKLLCHGIEIIFITNSKKIANYFLTNKEQIPETIPGINIKRLNEDFFDENKPYLKYLDNNIKKTYIDPIINQIIVSCPENELYLPDLIYLLLSQFSKELNKQNKYLIHSAVVEKNGKALIISGNPGSGKTTLALQFCMKHNYNFVSNDRSILGMENGEIKVFEGTMQTHVRLGVIHKYFPQLIPKIDKEKMNHPWENKIYINPEFENLGIKTTKNVKIDKLVYVQTYPVKNELTHIKKLPEDVAILEALKTISEPIRAGKNAVLSTNEPFPSFDTNKLSHIRMNFVNNLVKNIKMYKAHGNIDEIIKQIEIRDLK